MAKLEINQKLVTRQSASALVSVCPFGAIEYDGRSLSITDSCRMCLLCTKASNGAITLVQADEVQSADPAGFCRDIAVFAQQQADRFHPVTFELLGKAYELAQKSGGKVCCVAVGSGVAAMASQLARYGAEEVAVYDSPLLRYFDPQAYAACLEDFVAAYTPGMMMIGATDTGRSLAPRVAARFKTGLTADCTGLDIDSGGGLVQTRPAFGGNIMAQIVTPKRRPQLCTVRPKVFGPVPTRDTGAAAQRREIPAAALEPGIKVLDAGSLPAQVDISEAEYIVAVGRGAASKRGIEAASRLAGILGAQLAGTRPVIEQGMLGPRQQIGLSGRTVKPKLIITLGISGAVQFAAGMSGSHTIVAVNTDRSAPIFGIAHLGLVGDVCDTVDQLLALVKEEGYIC